MFCSTLLPIFHWHAWWIFDDSICVFRGTALRKYSEKKIHKTIANQKSTPSPSSATFFDRFSCFRERDFHIFTILWPLVVNPTPHLICASSFKIISGPILFATFHNYPVLDRDFYAPIIRLNCSGGFFRLFFSTFCWIVNYSMFVFRGDVMEFEPVPQTRFSFI